MALEKHDLEQIEKIVERTEKRLEQKIDGTENRLDKKIDSVEKGLDQKLDKQKNEIISVITREIIDLGEINRAVIDRVDKIAEIEKDIIRIKAKIGIK